MFNFFKKSQKPAQTSSNPTANWNIYKYSYGDNNEMLAVIRFSTSYKNEATYSKYNQEKRIIIFAKEAYENGLISKEYNEELASLENDLTNTVNNQDIKGELCGTMMYGGLKEWVFEIKNDSEEQFDKSVAKILKGHEYEVKTNSAWDFFDRKIKPTEYFEMQMENRDLISVIEKESTKKENKEYNLEFMFVGDENKLVKLKKILDQKHFNTSMNLDKINTLQVFYSTVLELDTITDLSHFLYKMSEDYQVKYDGWGTKV